MFQYIIRRLLLMIPTFFGTTLLVFVILQKAPGGPFEQAMQQLQAANMQQGEGGGISGNNENDIKLSEEVVEQYKREYGVDKPIFTRYLIWLGLAEKEMARKKIELGIPFRHTIKNLGKGEHVPISLQQWILVTENKKSEIQIYESEPGTDFEWKNKNYPILIDQKNIKGNMWKQSSDWTLDKKISKTQVEIVLNKNQGILTGYLGYSEQHNEDVSILIWERLHISLILGITGFIFSYLICIPLGITKALRHGSKFDIGSSFIVFLGYSIPSYAAGVLLLLLLATNNVFDVAMLPSRGWRPDNWEELDLMGKVIGQFKHALMPIICYMIGSFATLTILMKNSLMENLSQDYVRTAFAKGLTEKRVVFFHAVRNSLIPLATGIGSLIGLFLAGSYIIEKIFGIDGIGLLTFKAIGARDYGIVMGFVVIGTFIRLFGNLISDMCYALIDPRIRFK